MKHRKRASLSPVPNGAAKVKPKMKVDEEKKVLEKSEIMNSERQSVIAL